PIFSHIPPSAKEATMSTRHRLQGCFLLLFVFLNPMALGARNLIRVDEEKTRLASDGRSSILKLALASDFTRDVPVHIDIEVLDTDDRVKRSRAIPFFTKDQNSSIFL